MSTNSDELRALLKGHTGGGDCYAHAMVRTFVYTDGFRSFLQNAGQGAYWLADILATEPLVAHGVRKNGEFAIVLLHVQGKKAELTVSRDCSETQDAHGRTISVNLDGEFYRRHIDYTDCPEGYWKFYLSVVLVGEGQEALIAMLPSEY